MSVITLLPNVDGKYREHVNLANKTWFGVGGKAEILFNPQNTQDLAYFIKHKPQAVVMHIIGAGSNLIIRDGGIQGVVIKLGRYFTNIYHDKNYVVAGAGTLNYNFANYCRDHSITGFEYLSGIPGSIGGALAMNAGAYGQDTSSILVKAEVIDNKGNIIYLTNRDFAFTYRQNALPKEWIFTKAYFKLEKGSIDDINATMNKIRLSRETTQPIKVKTSGSSFKNPSGYKAWRLIDQAGCRGLLIGDAMISTKHCNFIINRGNATADDIEKLGEIVKIKVKETSGIDLEWEIQIIGERIL